MADRTKTKQTNKQTKSTTIETEYKSKKWWLVILSMYYAESFCRCK